MRRHHLYYGAAIALVAAATISARKRAPLAASVPADAVAYHGAWQLYRTLAVFFGKKALVAEAHYWEVVNHA